MGEKMAMMNTTERNPAGLEMLAKANSVITALGLNGEMNVAQLAEAVGEPVSSMYRLLAGLSAIGWVEPGSKRGLYRLGLYFLRIGGLVEERIDIRDAARPHLSGLRGATGATSFLCLQRGSSAVCVERIEGDSVSQLAMRLGDSLPLYSGAAPMALYAFLPATERKAVDQSFAADPHASREIEAAGLDLARRAAEVRDRGFSVSDGDVTPGIAAVGAPVFNHRGEVEAAISVSGLRDTILGAGKKTTELVVTAAAAVSTELGFRGKDESL